MPIYEFVCENCFEEFEELVSFNKPTVGLTCPACGSDLVRKVISTFAPLNGGTRSAIGALSQSSCSPKST
jgi:putative FmdB family regulatory protein